MPYKHGVMQNMIDSGISKPAPKYSHLALPAVLSILACTFSLFQPASAILTTCYDASGAVRPDVPCYQDAVNSACCGQGWGMNPYQKPDISVEGKEKLIRRKQYAPMCPSASPAPQLN